MSPRKLKAPATAQTALRLSQALLDRAEALAPLLAADPERAGTGSVNRSDVLRLALTKGLTVLERQYRRGPG